MRQKLRRFPPEHAAIIDKQVDVMLKQGIIEPSVSEWSSNVVIVKKKDVRGLDGKLSPPHIVFALISGRSKVEVCRKWFILCRILRIVWIRCREVVGLVP